ncbi:bifunctional RNase H/acid phosphatase [Streptomyces verrucosisporus]|uniref:bifunctional RNase H/acid phosphatase n=1 Tax=Streptomyces verrucosisporus TaxID=1695161 RepID=UPI0019D02DDD|nr:bifunctional RNase H/acid phosphatase [Streptomyces verrucosisporus]MBN3928164.1 bifunctional RNase H/acid phosphatase [Streptomyces verrucosisporus]
MPEPQQAPGSPDSRRTFVVEADGGSRGNPGPAGYGAVVRDAGTGRTLSEAAEYIGTATNNVAEYRGLIAGLRAAHALDPRALVRVRMDSKLVVEQMSGRWKIKHPAMRPLALEAASVFPPESVTYQWIPREENKHADRLANEAMDAGRRGREWRPADSTAELDAGAHADTLPGLPGTSVASGAPAATPESSAGARAAARAAVRQAVRETHRTAAADGRGAGTDAPTALTAADELPVEPAGPADRAVPAGRGEPSTPQTGWGADMGTPTTLVLLRHGETPLTPLKRFSGSGGTDPELSATGLRQAEAAASALAARGTVQQVISSPLVRCRRTARAVADRLGLGVEVEHDLREADFGAWEGLTFAEVRERYPDDLDAWLASPEAAPTGGESFARVIRRVEAARDRILARHAGRTVLLVTHVTPVKVLACTALGAPPEALFRMELSAASLSAVAYYADGNASLRLLNDTGHLR